jgi:hypothetical protein
MKSSTTPPQQAILGAAPKAVFFLSNQQAV